MAGHEKYLLVKGRAGLGTRMLSTATGLLFARLSGRRLVVDWGDETYSDDGSDVFERFFVCRSSGHLADIPETDSVTPRIWRGHLRDSVLELKKGQRHRGETFRAKSTLDLKKGVDYDELVVVFWRYRSGIDLLRPHFRGDFADFSRMKPADILRRLLTLDLALHPTIQRRVDDFRSENLDGRTVGVHIRWSDRRSRVKQILDRLRLLVTRYPDLTIFAATDNVDVKEVLERMQPGVVTAPHWYPPPGQRMHGSPAHADHTPLAVRRMAASRLENAIEALVDMYLLAGCHHLIGDSTSSFVRVAALLQPSEGTFHDVRPRPQYRVRVAREIWRRYGASGSALGGFVRDRFEGDYPASWW
jgi:hypothetical protein